MPKKWWVLATVACGTFMATLDSSIVNIALPTLTKALHTDLRSVKWVIVIYLLTITCTLLPFGRLSDLYGRKPVFKYGFLIFTLGSLFCGLAQSLMTLIFSRILQGLGASMLMSNGPAIITSAFELRSRGKALGILSMVVSAGLVCGPSIGGALITNFDWRSIFLVNLPIGVMGFAFASRILEDSQGKENPGPFDFGGAFLLILVLLSFILFVDPPTLTIAGSKPIVISRFSVGILFTFFSFVFIVIQRQVPEPILEFSLFKYRTFWAANLANFMNLASFSALLVLLPFYLEEVMGYSPEHAGYLMSVIPLTVFIVAPISGHLTDIMGSRILSGIGAGVATFSLFYMGGLFGHGLTELTKEPLIILSLCVCGLSSGLFQSPNNVALMSSIPSDRLGVASAMMATIRNLGLVTGTGLAAKLFSWRHEETGDFVKALQTSLILAGGVAFISVLAVVAKKDIREQEK